MARVVIPEVFRNFTNGDGTADVSAKDARSVLKALDAQYPGLAKALTEQCLIAIDGNIYPKAMLQPVLEESEVFFVFKIAGG